MASMKDLLGSLKNTADLMERQSDAFGSVVTDLSSSYKLGSDLIRANADAVKDMQKTLMGASRTQAQSIRMQNRVAKEIASNQKKLAKIQKQIETARQNGDAAEIERLNYKLAHEFKQTKKIMDYRSQRIQEEQTAAEEQFKAYKDLMTNHKKNLKELGGFAKNVGGQLKGGDLAGAVGGGMDGMASILKQLSGVGGKLGMVAGALGATVGVLGMFVTLMLEADKAAKDLNKNILKGASGLDLMGKNFSRGKITERLGEMRNMAYDIGMQFRMSAGDVADLMSSFNQFGMTYKEMGSFVKSNDPTEGLERGLQIAIRNSHMLGAEASTVAETMAQMNENFAMDLSQIDEAFKAIYMSAQTTGIATQKFYAMITQVTGGMSLLNVDFAQTAAIAGELVEALGEAAGGKFLEDLANRGASKSYEERFKSAILAGGKTSRISKKGAAARAKKLEQSQQFKDLTSDPAFIKMLGAVGVQMGTGKGQLNVNDLLGSMGGMTKMQRNAMLAQFGNTAVGGNAALERQMRALSQLQISSKQGGIFGQAVQMGQFNTGENLAQALAEIGGFANLEAGQSLGGLSRAKLEKLSGRSGMEVDQLVTFIDKINSNLDTVKKFEGDIAGRMKEGMSARDAIAAEAAEAGYNSPREFQKMLKEQFKVTIGTDGKMRSSETGELVDGLETYMVNIGDSMNDSINEAMSLENSMSQEIVENTGSMATILENMIGQTLNKIYTAVEGIFMEFVGRDMDNERFNQQLRDATDQISDAYDNQAEQQAKLSEFETKRKTGKMTAQDEDAYARQKQMVDFASKKVKYEEARRGILMRNRDYSQATISEINQERDRIYGEQTNVDFKAEDKKLQQKEARKYLMRATQSFRGATIERIADDDKLQGYKLDPIETNDFYNFAGREALKDSVRYQQLLEGWTGDREILEKIMEEGVLPVYRTTTEHPKFSAGTKLKATTGSIPTLEASIMAGEYAHSKRQSRAEKMFEGSAQTGHLNQSVFLLGRRSLDNERQKLADASYNRAAASAAMTPAQRELMYGGFQEAGFDDGQYFQPMTPEQAEQIEEYRNDPKYLEQFAVPHTSSDNIADNDTLAKIKGEKGIKAALESKDLLATLVDEFEESAKDTEQMKDFQAKKLPKEIGQEVLIAFMAEKMFEIGQLSGGSLSMRELLKAATDPNSQTKPSALIRSKITDPNKREEALGIAKTLGLEDGYFDGTVMKPMGKGALIFTKDGGYHTKDDGSDHIAVSHNGKAFGGGGSGAGGAIIIKGDIVLKGVQDPRSFGKQLRAHFKDRRNKRGKGV